MELLLRPNHYYMGYPVGEEIMKSLKEIKYMVDFFMVNAKEDIEEHEYINFIGRGSSGALIGAFFADKLIEKYPDKITQFVHIKKEDEHSHDSKSKGYKLSLKNSPTYGEILDIGLNVFVDDFTASGNTIYKTIQEVRKLSNKGTDFSFDYIILSHSNVSIMGILSEKNITKKVITTLNGFTAEGEDVIEEQHLKFIPVETGEVFNEL